MPEKNGTVLYGEICQDVVLDPPPELLRRAQMSDNYWAYLELADGAESLLKPPDRLCRESTTTEAIVGFYNDTIGRMSRLLEAMPPDEGLSAESYFNIDNFTLECFIQICNERAEGNLPGDLIEVGSKMVAGEPVTI